MGELMYHTDMSMDQMRSMMGTSDRPLKQNSQPNNRLPELKISSQRKDESGNDIKKHMGEFYVKGLGEPVYAKSVRVRVLSQLYQWVDFDEEQMRPRNKTIMIPFLNMEPRDELGTIRCGKPLTKDMADWPKAKKAQYDSINLFRQLRGLVTYEGQTADGKTVSIENQPCIIMNKRSSYMKFEQGVISRINGREFSDYWLDVTSEEQEMGSVVYYTWKYTPDLKNPVSMDDDTEATLDVIARMVVEENIRIENSYKKNRQNYELNEEALQALKSVEADLDADLVDLPD